MNLCRAGDVWRDSVARVRVVSGPKEYPAIVCSEEDSCSLLEVDRNSRVESRVGLPVAAKACEEPTPTRCGDVVTKVDTPGGSTGMCEMDIALNGEASAALWMEEFQERYELEQEAKRAFEHFRSLEVEDYLRVYRTSRQFHNLKVDYFGERMNSLCLHRLEQQYIKQGIEARRKQNSKDHEACIIKIQERALDGAKKRLPPLKTAIGELEAPESPSQLPKVTPNPPVLRESRRRNPSDIEWRRQKRLLEQEEAPTEGPKQFKFFPLVL